MKNYLVHLDGVSLGICRDAMRDQCEKYAQIINHLIDTGADSELLEEYKWLYEQSAEALYKLLNNAFEEVL